MATDIPDDESMNPIFEKYMNGSVHFANGQNKNRIAILMVYDDPGIDTKTLDVAEFIKNNRPIQEATIRQYDPLYNMGPTIFFP